MRTLKEIRNYFTTLILENELEQDKLIAELEAYRKREEQVKLRLNQAQEQGKAKDFEQGQQELLLVQNSIQFKENYLKQLYNKPLISQMEYKLLIEEIKKAAKTEQEPLTKELKQAMEQTYHLHEKSSEISEELFALLNILQQNLIRNSQDYYKTSTGTIDSNLFSPTSQAENYTPAWWFIDNKIKPAVESLL